MRCSRFSFSGLGLVLGLLVAASAWAKPPPWAPAHGYRAKNDPFYVGYTGRQWQRDYGILAGRCNTDDILAAVGAVAGGVIGGRVASPDTRVVGVVVGAIIGGVIGDRIGDRIDERDRACVGHSLELARTGQTVRWTNPATGLAYDVRPVRDLADGCREFELVVRDGKRGKPAKLRGCSRGTGSWSIG